MNKFIKTLIIVNGVIIPLVLLVIFSIFLKEVVFQPSYKPNSDGIKLSNKIANKKGDTIVYQGVDYDKPQPIYNSTNSFIAISPKNMHI
jgi:hypothetical protein